MMLGYGRGVTPGGDAIHFFNTYRDEGKRGIREEGRAWCGAYGPFRAPSSKNRICVKCRRIQEMQNMEKQKKIRTQDDSAFKVAAGMELGAHENGNLRMVVTQPDGSQVAVELPHAWLHQEGGVVHFVKENCHPGSAVETPQEA